MKLFFLLALVLGMLVSCGDTTETLPSADITLVPETDSNSAGQQRWYNQSQLQQGAEVFSNNCAVCHGDQAQGLAENWRQRMPDGNFPPPPLNGSAHAWHHPLVQLTQTIETGGEPYGGQMPPFKEVLNEGDSLAAIAFFQSFWDDDTYLGWLDLGGLD